jgi:hypothetical protein
MLARSPLPLFALLLPTLLSACSDGESQQPWHGSQSVALVQYQTCNELEADIKARAIEELDVILEQYAEWGIGTDDGAAPGEGEGDGAGDDRDEGEDFSGTNNQEDGVDEADLVKTDGYHVYVVNGNRLHVFGVPEFGELVPASETELEGNPYELVLDSEAGRAAVFSFVSVDSLPEDHPLRTLLARGDGDESLPYRTWGISKISIFDVSDPTEPALEREVWVEGWYQTARRTDHSLRLVANGWIQVPGLDDLWNLFYEQGGEPDLEEIRAKALARIEATDLAELIPRLYERLPSGDVRTHSLAGSDCRSFSRPSDSAGRATSTILSFDLSSDELRVDADTIVSNWGTVYASRDRLYLAEFAWDWWWGWSKLEPGEVFTPATNIHAFDVTRPGRARYVGSGRVDGTLFQQFAMDEEDGLLRVAATTRPWRAWSEGDEAPPPASENHIYILEERGRRLDTVGHLGGIAPNESIFAARFLPTEAFIITFEQIDPLFTIDLSNPRRPRLVGELEMPGFSTYLHPIADDRILAIGVGGDENGANWNTQVSLFDVSNRAEPEVVAAEELTSQGWGWSEAMYEHKAFQYFAPKKMLAVPMSSYDYGDSEEVVWHTRLELLGVEPNGLRRHGAIDHSRFYTGEEPWWWGAADVRRSIFMGDFIYVLSSRALTVHRLDDLSEVTAQQLPLAGLPYWWW